MNANVSDLIKAAMGDDAKGKNVQVISDNMTGNNYRDPGFLSDYFPRGPPKLYFTAESEEFDQLTLREWADEGFNVEYIPMGDDLNEYQERLERLSRQKRGPCETFGIVAYGDAAACCLEHYHIMDNNPEYKLGLLIAYYPTSIPDPKGRFPSSIKTLVHLAGEDVGVVKQSQMIGIQGKRRVTRRKLERGLGTGETLRLAYRSYTYSAEPGFAEHDLDIYKRVPAELAFSRSLAVARDAFKQHVDLELALDTNVQGKFFTRNVQDTLSTYTTHKEPHVTYVPTLTGGIGAAELERFYSEFFISSNPPSTKLTLLSRTIGADRVVDELHVRFRHTQEMPWILPGVPPTNKRVMIIVISIVTLRGGKLYHEHVYWDQASVLVQVGLLDPNLVPDKARKELGVEKLPVVGGEAAKKILLGRDGPDEGEADNALIPEWDEGNDEEEEPSAENGDDSEKSQTGQGGQSGKTEGSTQKEKQKAPEKVAKESKHPVQSSESKTQALPHRDKGDEKIPKPNKKSSAYVESQLDMNYDGRAN